MKKQLVLIILALFLASCGDDEEESKRPAQKTPEPQSQEHSATPEKPKDRVSRVIFNEAVIPNASVGFNLKNSTDMIYLSVKLVADYFFCEVQSRKTRRFSLSSGPISVDNKEGKVYFNGSNGKVEIGQVIYMQVNNQWEYVTQPCDIYACEVRVKLSLDKNQRMSCEIRLVNTNTGKTFYLATKSEV